MSRFGYSFLIGTMIVVAVMFVAWLAGERRRAELSPEETFEKYRVLTDPRTRCQYLRGHQELTPRMGADGKQLCGGGGK